MLHRGNKGCCDLPTAAESCAIGMQMACIPIFFLAGEKAECSMISFLIILIEISFLIKHDEMVGSLLFLKFFWWG